MPFILHPFHYHPITISTYTTLCYTTTHISNWISYSLLFITHFHIQFSTTYHQPFFTIPFHMTPTHHFLSIPLFFTILQIIYSTFITLVHYTHSFIHTYHLTSHTFSYQFTNSTLHIHTNHTTMITQPYPFIIHIHTMNTPFTY